MSDANLEELRPAAPELAEWTINDLVAAYPETMSILAPLGLDLCCGGAHRLGHALDLHALDRAAVISRIAEAIGQPAARGGTA